MINIKKINDVPDPIFFINVKNSFPQMSPFYLRLWLFMFYLDKKVIDENSNLLGLIFRCNTCFYFSIAFTYYSLLDMQLHRHDLAFDVEKSEVLWKGLTYIHAYNLGANMIYEHNLLYVKFSVRVFSRNKKKKRSKNAL